MLRLSAPLLALLLSACDPPIAARDCDALLDHYVELLSRSDGKKPTTEEILRLQREAHARARAGREFSRCPEEVSKRQLDCALAAHTADDVERCLL